MARPSYSPPPNPTVDPLFVGWVEAPAVDPFADDAPGVRRFGVWAVHRAALYREEPPGSGVRLVVSSGSVDGVSGLWTGLFAPRQDKPPRLNNGEPVANWAALRPAVLAALAAAEKGAR